MLFTFSTVDLHAVTELSLQISQDEELDSLTKQQKGLLEVDIKTKLLVTKHIWQWFSCDTYKQSHINTCYKPAHVRMCMLDLSKVLMYKFHYDYIKNRYGINSRLPFIVTNSLIYEIRMDDVFEDFSKDKEMFNFSNYVPVKILMIQTN